MPSKNISELYVLKRYPQNTVGLFTFILYLPFGILLLLLRAILGIQVFVFGFLLPDIPVIQKLLCKLFCATLGIIVCKENGNEKKNVDVYITNFISPFDHLVIHSQTGAVTPGKDVFNTLLSTSFGLRQLGSQSVDFPSFKKNVAKTIESGVPIHLQPELKQTNGKAILKFTTWPFQLCKQVQPICIEVSRPFLDIKISTFDSVYWTDTIMYLFSPYTSYKLRFLPIVDQFDLSEIQFSDKVRENIARALQVELSEYSATDLLHWEKRLMDDVVRREMEGRQRPTSTSLSSGHPTIHLMATQVKEVLPMVPYTVIYTDLLKTRSVDQTISNIFEGNVEYIPEPVQPSTSHEQRDESDHVKAILVTSVGKSPQDRMVPFQERKRQLLETARKRYITKHNITSYEIQK